MSRTDELPDDTPGWQLILAVGYATQSIGVGGPAYTELRTFRWEVLIKA